MRKSPPTDEQRAQRNAYMREWNRSHAAHVREQRRLRRLANPEQVTERRRIYRARNAKRINEMQRASYEKHRERYAAYAKKYYAENRDQARAYYKNWRERNRGRDYGPLRPSINARAHIRRDTA
jgi:hypothetical protein